MKRRESPAAGSAAGCGGLSGGSLAKSCPVLWEFLTAESWDDGTAREVGTVLIVVEDGCVKMWLNDKAQGVTCWVSSSSWDGLLKAASHAIEGTGAGWRAAKPAGGPRKGR